MFIRVKLDLTYDLQYACYNNWSCKR